MMKLRMLFLILLLPHMLIAQQVSSLMLTSGEPSCHASTVLEVAPNRLLVAYFAGQYERHPEVCIYLQEVDGRRMRAQKVRCIADGVQNDTLRYPCWNPVLTRLVDGRIALFYKVGPSPQEWWGMLKISNDNGRTWSAAQRLPDGILGPVRCKPIQSSHGLLCGSSTESIDSLGRPHWRVHVEVADATLKHWQRIDVECDTFDAIQPTLINFGGDSLMMMCRTLNRCIAFAESKDGGQTWSPLHSRPEPMPNSNSGVDAILKDGKVLVAMNPMVGTNYLKGRNILAVCDLQNIIEHYIECQESGEFSYPAMVEGADGALYIAYTYNRQAIKLVKIK